MASVGRLASPGSQQMSSVLLCRAASNISSAALMQQISLKSKTSNFSYSDILSSLFSILLRSVRMLSEKILSSKSLIGEIFENEENNKHLSDAAEILINCKYKQPYPFDSINRVRLELP